MAEPLGCSAKLRWLNHGMVWVWLQWLEPIRHKRGLLCGCDAHIGGETLVGTYKLNETIEQPCRGLVGYVQSSTHLGSV
jgi:hypothetical protein